MEKTKLKRKRHPNIRYFFITSKIKKGEVIVAFCSVINMLADIFTKPLQGSVFEKIQNAILNLLDTENINDAHRIVLEENKNNGKESVEMGQENNGIREMRQTQRKLQYGTK